MDRPLIFYFVLLFLFFSCQNDLEEIDKIINREMISVETAKDVSMLYSDSAVVRVMVKGPVMLRHLDKENPRQEFTDGVKVVFFTAGQQVESILTAKFAERIEKKNRIIVRDSVVWESLDGEKLETEELIWEERKEKIFTKRFVTITKPDEILYGVGFEAKQDFSTWEIHAPEGVVKTESFGDDRSN